MTETYGFTETAVLTSKILRDGYFRYTGGIIASGELSAETVEGAVLCYSGGKYYAYRNPTAKTDETATATPAPNGSATQFYLQIGTAGSIEPGSVIVKYTASSVAKTIGNDDGCGNISSVNGYGVVNYNNGTIWINTAAAPDNGSVIKISYNHYLSGRNRPVAILVKPTDASLEDRYVSIYISGGFWAVRLSPDISSSEYVKTQLRKLGINAY